MGSPNCRESERLRSSWEPRQDHYKNRQGFILYDGIEGMGVHHVTGHYQDYEFEGDTLTLYPLRNRYPKTRLKWVKVNQRKK